MLRLLLASWTVRLLLDVVLLLSWSQDVLLEPASVVTRGRVVATDYNARAPLGFRTSQTDRRLPDHLREMSSSWGISLLRNPALQYSTVFYCILLYSLYSTVFYCILQYSTVFYSRRLQPWLLTHAESSVAVVVVLLFIVPSLGGTGGGASCPVPAQ